MNRFKVKLIDQEYLARQQRRELGFSDIEKDLAKVLSKEIMEEIDKEIISSLSNTIATVTEEKLKEDVSISDKIDRPPVRGGKTKTLS